VSAPSRQEISPERLHWQIERFYFAEAQMLDDRKLLDWVDLFTDDATYTVSIHEKLLNRQHPSGPEADHTEVLHTDDKGFLGVRARRLLETMLAHAEKPPSITRRIVGNIVVDETQATDNQVAVRSNFIVYQARFHMYETFFAGTRNDLLQTAGDGFRIAQRRVLLDQFTLARTLTIFF